ncbi:Mce protein [Mycobacterium intermedium]|uniref:Mce protein n=1 Tax=Mycobacterium intermedium TaxID=28445 RepID=A0A1E3SL73_MYCIE|nr:Mce protein [Mycobacterium intermedium]MCV6963487.1 Mce protein [Mycobacterium intermedium]ODR02862.1 Mce protein [Mycobacterium intermedium]OPE49910.1 Mce protein [Mycobacterium intermedium]ORB02761.1 Mce protein [Mycobacterium intermedium]
MTTSLCDEREEVQAATAVAASAEPGAPPRNRFRRTMTAALALLIVTLAAATGYFMWQYYHARNVQAAGEAALKVATSYAVTLTSVDSNNLDANFNAVLDGATGEFRDLYSQSSSKLRQLLIDHKATGHGVVVDSAIKSATETQVVVLLFVDQTVTNTDVPNPRVDRSRIVMTMQKIDGRWKAGKVEIP